MLLRTDRYKKKAFAILTTVILALAFLTLALTSASDVSVSSVYAAPLYQNKNLVFDTDSSTYEDLANSYYYDTVLDFGNGVSVDGNYYVSGDFYSGGSFSLSRNGNIVYMNNQPSGALNANLGIDPAGDLAAAINDGLLSVQLSLYLIYAAPQNADAGEEKASATLTYYDGTGEEGEGGSVIPNYKEIKGNISFPASNTVNSAMVTICTLALDKLFVDGGYVSVVLSDFQTNNNFSIAIKEIGIRTTVSPRTDITVVDGAAGITIYDQSGYRDPATATNIVKGGDIVVFNNVIQSGNEKYSLSTANSFGAEQSPHGRLYRKLILEGNSSETIIKPDFNTGYWERVYRYSYTDAEGVVHDVDISDDYSGEIIAFRVKDATVTNLVMNTGLWRANGKNSNVTRTLNFFMDNASANQPYLSSDDFYNKYIGLTGKNYYTNANSYTYETVKQEDGSEIQVISGVNLGAGEIIPHFTSQSLQVMGKDVSAGFAGSDQKIYYKATLLDRAPTTSGEPSKGFALSEATGVYCTVTAGLGEDTVIYQDLILSLKTVEDGKTVYKQNGIFSIEFVTVDGAGNRAIGPIKYFIRVDVADYEFDYSMVLGMGGDDSEISTSEVSLRFATLDDLGKPTSYKDEAVFKRGDKVLVQVRFTKTSITKYVLTNFKTENGSFSTTNSVYDASYSTVIMQSSTINYTFEVTSVFSENPDARRMILTFKQYAEIVVSNETQIYNGSGKGVQTRITVDGNNIIGTVTTYYATSEDGEYSTNLPVNAGTYYYRCELLNHRTYYGKKTGTLVIKPATPSLDALTISGDVSYGESLAKIDFDESAVPQQFNDSILALNRTDGKYYSNRSSDGIYGYFILTNIDKTGDGYLSPSAGIVSVTVQFVPIKHTMINGEPEFIYENGKFVRDTNYDTANYTLSVEINYSEEVAVTVDGVGEDNIISVPYDGNEKPVTFELTSALASESGLILTEYGTVYYKSLSDPNATEVLVAPTEAGDYAVSIRIAEGRCNYTGEWEFTLRVEKRVLDISCSEKTFDYQRLEKFLPTAIYNPSSGEAVTYNGLNYSYEFFRYSGSGSWIESATEENRVSEEEYFAGTGTPENAGVYVLKIVLDENNFVEKVPVYTLYTVRKATSSSSILGITVPTVAYNTSAKDSHLSWKQPLSDVTLTYGTNTGVNYTYQYLSSDGRILTEVRPVEGEFFISYRLYDKETETPEEFLAEMNAYDGFSVGSHTVYIYFVASGEEGANFEPLYRQTTITVGKAQYDFANVSVADISFGTPITSVEDIVFSGLPRILVNAKQGIYTDVQADDAELGFVYSLGSVKDGLYEAGSYYLDVTVTPVNSESVAEVIYSFTIVVNKKVVDIMFDFPNEAQDGFYVYSYGKVDLPTVSFDGLEEGYPDISGGFSFYGEDGTLYQPASANDLTVGVYRAIYNVSAANYAGSKEFSLRVDKADLVNKTSPDIFNSAVSVSYGKLMKDVVFSGGQTVSAVTGKVVGGTYAMDYPADKIFLMTGVAYDYDILFTPDDTVNYNVLRFTKSLTVGKNDIGSAMTASASAYVYGILDTASLNLSDIVAYTTPVWYKVENDVRVYSNVYIEGYEYLPVITEFVSIVPSSGALPAGDYRVRVTVDDYNYGGSIECILTVEKKEAILTVVKNNKPFNNKNQSVDYVLKDVDGNVISESVVQTFYSDGIRLNGSPGDIGKYQAVLSLRSNNYYCDDVTTDFVISVDETQISVSNNEQVYNIPRNVSVTLGLNMAVFTVSYRGLDENGEENGLFYETLPSNAGQYLIVLTFDAVANNGYSDIIVCKERLTISKYTARIDFADELVLTYTGKSAAISAVTVPYGLSYTLEFCAEGSDEFTTEEVLNANTEGQYHIIRFTINDKNYQGVKEVRYTIKPASLNAISAPVFGNYEYNTDTLPECLTEGEIYFGVEKLEGVFALNLDEMKTLSAGAHDVSYTFTAYGEDGQIDNNYLVYTGTTRINIVKRDVAEFIVMLNADEFVVRYNGSPFYALPDIAEDVIYDRYGVNADFRIDVYYNGTSNPPVEPGAYEVSLEVVSKNYTGTLVYGDFVVNRGIPEITVLPTVSKQFEVGQTITSGDLSGGRATLSGKTVYGTFSVEETTFVNANYNFVKLMFTPDNTDLYESGEATLTVFVEGENPLPGLNRNEDWTDTAVNDGIHGEVKITVSVPKSGVYYGNPLSVFNLAFTGDAEYVEYLNANGKLSFVNPDAVLEVGDKAEIIYMPVDDETYTIMTGTIDVDIVKAPWTGEYTFTLDAFAELPLKDAVFTVYEHGKALDREGTLSLTLDGMPLAPETYPTLDMDGKTLEFLFVTKNYQDLTGTVEISIVGYIPEEDIVVENLSKNYDGLAISVSDLGISANNVEVQIEESDVTLTLYENGVISEGRETGVYTVVINIRSRLYFGTKTVEFTVLKRDVSDRLSLSVYSSEYGSFVTPSALYDGVAMTAGTYTLEYKRAADSDAYYSSNTPVNAGEYNVKVSVDNENEQGTKVFVYTVAKKSVTAVNASGGNRFEYDYGKAAVPVITFTDAEGNVVTVGSTLHYYSAIYTYSETLPTNAGEYTVRVTLDDDNYTLGVNGYAEFAYVIRSMTVIIGTKPVASAITDGDITYNLKYGQSLSELNLVGGEATREDVAVKGFFKVRDGSVYPDAGTRIITVVFLPTDANYAEQTCEIEIYVAPADATVTFTKLQTSYTGTSRKNQISYTVSPSNVRVSITFTSSDNSIVSDPVNAGNYRVQAVSLDSNYRVTNTTFADGSNPYFTIAKASVDRAVAPKANAITVGDSLIKSSLVSGSDYGLVYYVGFNNPVPGKFTFVESSLSFKKAGTFTVAYNFMPDDSANFASFTGETTVTVNKGVAEISVGNATYVYSEGFSYPTFTTSPGNLKVVHNITFREYDPSSADYVYNDEDIVDVGTYYFKAWVEDENYTSKVVEFAITITKKDIDMDFVKGSGSSDIVQQYVTTYGKLLYASFRLYQAGTPGKNGYLLKDEVVNGDHIAATYEIKYASAQSGLTYDSHVPPSAIGTYTVTVKLVNKNYTATKSILYKVERGTIENVYFDTATLENQIYGSVVPPIITTSPANVSYYIVYQGYDTVMPTDAGSYNITVYFNDDNYEKKQVSAMFKINKKPLTVTNIEVSDKVYDGVSSLSIKGQLSGVLYGDEVNIAMTARTAEGAVNVGSHYVEITSYTLTGLQAFNYDLVPPVYYGQINIYVNKVSDVKSSSFITSTTGFNPGTKVEFSVIDSKENKADFFQSVTGRTTKVIAYTIKENGADTIIKNSFKVYVAIPEEFLDVEFEVEGAGALAGQNVVFTREGNYITFQASSAGQIVFRKTEVRYEFIVIVSAIGVVILGVIVAVCLIPLQNRRKTADTEREKETIRKIKRGF